MNTENGAVILKTGLRSAFDRKRIAFGILARCMKAAWREQGITDMVACCREILPDISDQYTVGFDSETFRTFWEPKLRGMHAFQSSLMLEAIRVLPKAWDLTVVDIGDSSGNHSIYLRGLTAPGVIGRVISVNLDPVAVQKIRAKGQEAIHCRAEGLDLGDRNIDLYMSFEMMEHLRSPLDFLHDLAQAGRGDHLLVTIPYVRRSRFGGDILRKAAAGGGNVKAKMTAEEVHLFELSPEDWQLMARFAGWHSVFTRIYRQYPRYSPWRVLTPVWQRFDFEGFFGMLLKRDSTLADQYADW